MAAGIFASVLLLLTGCSRDTGVTLLNVSYDPTRELYREFNEEFTREWQARSGQHLTIRQSHGGSGSQARAVINGLDADVVTLALAYDINSIQTRGKRLGANWQTRFDDNSSPYASVIVFLVRKGNPKGIHDWADLVRDDVSVVTPNPKTSGGARWNFLAAWGYELHRQLGDWSRLDDPAATAQLAQAQAAAQVFVGKLYANAPILDNGARAATNSFVQRDIGDVLITWENEALLALRAFGTEEVEIVTPSITILAEPPVAVVDTVVDRRGTRQVAEAYLQHLYSDVGQELVAKNFFRPRNAQILERHRDHFPVVPTFTVDEVFGGWNEVHERFFADDAVFDRIYKVGR